MLPNATELNELNVKIYKHLVKLHSILVDAEEITVSLLSGKLLENHLLLPKSIASQPVKKL